ncbi:MAG: T9SS type A sorting domain-containing protein [Calditrichaeota bacterium]|nr:T9SS type A sorting domain-containing protein [Calditrichota bacterium]
MSRSFFNLSTTFIICFLLIAISTGIAASANENAVNVTCENLNNGSLKLSIQVDQPEREHIISDNNDYDLLYFRNEPGIEIEGLPVLPFIARSILVPADGDIQLHIDNITSRIEGSIIPVPARFDANETFQETYPRDESDEITQLEEQFFSLDGFWPPQVVVVGERAILRGYHLLNFRVYPVQYNRSTGETRFNEQVDFHFSFENNNLNNPELLHPANPSIYAWRAVRNLVENPPPEPSRDDLQSAQYLYIVPEVDGVDEALAPLIEWRNRQGHKVDVVHVGDNAARGEITGIIRDAYAADPPVEFVALVGDAAQADFNIQAATQTGDYQYSLLDGNDELPDIAIGRISVDNLNQLDRVVNKLVSYESAPYMDDLDWFLQGAVIAGHRGNGLGSVLVSKYVRKELLDLGFQEVRHFYHTEDGEIGGNQPFLTDCMHWGISMLSYRAYQYMNRLNTNIIYNWNNSNGRWPVVLAISCDTGDFTNANGHTEAFFRAEGGGIGAIGTATPGTSVQYNNMMAGGAFKGMYKDKLYMFGWGLNTGKYELWRSYDGFDNRYMNFMDWNNLMGDPGTHIWTGVPRRINVEHQEMVVLGDSYISVHVTDLQEGTDEVDALVCLYKEGELHQTAYTNETGVADFDIDPDALGEGELLVTVTKHNVHPYLGSIDVELAVQFVGAVSYEVDDDADGESVGNQNGAINPGETIELIVNVGNYGEDIPEGDFTVEAVAMSEWIEVIGEPVGMEFIPDIGETIPLVFLANVNPASPDNSNQQILFNTTNGEFGWQSMLSVDIEAPQLVISGLSIEGGDLERGQSYDINLELFNAGRIEIDATHAILTTNSEEVNIIRSEADYDPIGIDDDRFASGEGYRIQIHPMMIPGMPVEFTLSLETESGFTTSASLEIPIGAPENNDPFGPDGYGYICFDSGDEGWPVAPIYEWLEINPEIDDHQFEGTNLNLSDVGDNQDESALVDLPFQFQYYGEDFNEITVCTNGWAAFGDQSMLAAFRNRHIGQALGPNAQLSIWWDNLKTVDGSSILTHYDEQGGRFIIEWSGMRRLTGRSGSGALETFQIILFDPRGFPTYTEDGIITYQYKEVENENIPAHNDTPFCTIGISNLDDSEGLEYTYWNQYPRGANEVRNEMAITFTTASSFISGYIQGRVINAADQDPIPNATITASRGFSTLTDENGEYSMEVLVGEDYEITASAEGWNDSTLVGFDVLQDSTIIVDFGLVFSEFAVSIEIVEEEVPENSSIDLGISLSNGGNGPLSWFAERTFNEGESGLGSRIQSFVLAQEVNDLWLESVAYVDHMFYVAGQNGQEPNMIYVFDEQAHFARRFQQPGNSNTGIRDLTYGNDLLWGSGERDIFGFNTDGDVVHTIRGPYSDNKALAYDSDRNVIWVNTPTRSIIAWDMDGDWVTAIDVSWRNITGMTYWPEDPDGYCLYVVQDAGNDLISVHKADPNTNDTAFVALLEPEGNEIGQSGGIFFSDDYGIYGNVLMVFVNDYLNRQGDRVDIWQMGTYKGWMSMDAMEGSVDPESQQDLVLRLNSAGMFPATYDGALTFSHTARGGSMEIPVVMHVYDPNNDVATETGEIPLKFDIETIYPNPFNSTTLIQYTLPKSGFARLAVFDIAGREIDVLHEGELNTGRYTSELNAQDWSSGVYLIQLKTSSNVKTVKVMCVK